MELNIFEMLREKYNKEGVIYAEEVSNATGSMARRRADAIAFETWPSRGLLIHGFEIKHTRSDWLTELADPHKADIFYPFCDHWWIVALTGVVKPEELPEQWGLMQAGKTLRIKKHAPKNENTLIDKGFMAALMQASLRSTNRKIEDIHRNYNQKKRVLRQEIHKEYKDKLIKKYNDGVYFAQLTSRDKIEALEHIELVRKQVLDETGIDLINKWESRRFLNTCKMLVETKYQEMHSSVETSVDHISRDLKVMHERIEKVIKLL